MRVQHAIAALSLSFMAAYACGNEEVVLFDLPARSIDASGGVAGSGGTSTGGVATGGVSTGGVSTGGIGTGGVSTGGVSTGGSGTGGIPIGGSSGSGGKAEPPFGGGPGGFGGPCSVDGDCPGNSFCEMPDCSSTAGFCVPRPVFCVESLSQPNPVCGCNRVTYWNECERRRAGERSQSFGECGLNALSCQTAEDCGSSVAFCSKLVARPDRCDDSELGTCWVIPESCSEESLSWIECLEEPPMPGDPPPEINCVDTCTAMRAERPFFPAGRRCEMLP